MVYVVVYSMSQPGIRWDGETSLDIACALTHTQAKGGGHDKQNFSFIHVRTHVELLVLHTLQ